MQPDTPRIRWAAPEEVAPRSGELPLSRAWRWSSPFDGPALQPVTAVFMSARAYVRCCAHAGSDLTNEVGGALVGRWLLDAETAQPFIVIESALPARHTRHGSTFLTFTQDSLVAFHDDLDRRYPGRELVGWFHTHPRMGVFLSGYDLWLHENFFPNPWQVALVIEPHTSQGGFFVKQADGRLDPRRYFGFYEILRVGRQSVVRWTNLRPEAAPQPKE